MTGFRDEGLGQLERLAGPASDASHACGERKAKARRRNLQLRMWLRPQEELAAATPAVAAADKLRLNAGGARTRNEGIQVNDVLATQ